jgi:hypothetical protein
MPAVFEESKAWPHVGFDSRPNLSMLFAVASI